MNPSPFTAHSQVVMPGGITPPRPVTIAITRPSPELLSEAYRAELQREIDAEAEAIQEGRIHRNTRPQRHE